MADKPIEIPLNGKCVTSVDPSLIGFNFQSLKNMRYTNTNPQGVQGMTKVNSSVMDGTYLKARSGIHFKKAQPAESHVLVQAYNTGLTASQVLDNKTAINSAGNFEATELHTDSSGAGRGHFSNAPGGNIAYCNSSESMIWGGDELRCAGFIHYNPDSDFSKDYLTEITNTLTDSDNIATLSSVVSGTVDSNTMLLLHCDGADESTTFTDSSPTTPHTVTANGNVQLDTSEKKFGTAAGLFDNAGDYLTIPDNADFDFSGGAWTVDFWVNAANLSAEGDVFYSQRTDANNYFLLYGDSNGVLTISIYAAGAAVVTVTTNFALITGQQVHVAFVEDDDEWYIFVNGILKKNITDTDRAANYTDLVHIGAANVTGSITNAFDGWIDEFRVSNVARWTSNFIPPTTSYGADSTNMYIGATRPLKGFKLYVENANTATGTMATRYWNGSTWVDVVPTDGTSVGGVPLAQTGSVSFTDTESLAKVRSINGVILYWYQIVISENPVDTTTTISQVTLDTSFQSVKDLWDGTPLDVLDLQRWDTTYYTDNTINVLEEDYDASLAITFLNFFTLLSTQHLLIGFNEKQMGLQIKIVDGSVNSATATLDISYWNGETWVIMVSGFDGTTDDTSTVSLSQSGTITWDSPAPNTEFRTEVGEGEPLYYYKLQWTANLTAGVKLDRIKGIPAQKTIGNYKFPLTVGNRLMLCADMDKDKNSAIISADGSVEIWNGIDSDRFFFGNKDTELTAGAHIYGQFGSSIYNIILITKANETYAVIGNSPADWIKYEVDPNVGCIAPETMKVINITKEGRNHQVAIWQGIKGIHLFDGRAARTISEDIENFFDPNDSNSINKSYIDISHAFIDEARQEYHWLFASGSSTTLDKEWVYDIKREKWYEIPRGSGAELQCGFEVEDTIGNKYNYGTIDTGYMEQLEKGTDFDGTAIAHELHTGDMSLGDSFLEEASIHQTYLQMVAKETTNQSVAMNIYGDTNNTAHTDSPISMSMSHAGYRTATVKDTTKFGARSTHSVKFTVSTDDETIGFEPLKLGFFIKTDARRQPSY